MVAALALLAMGLACATRQAPPSLPATATPPPPPGLIYSSEPTVGIVVARPMHWEREAGLKHLPISGVDVNYVVYYMASPAEVRVVNIFTAEAPFRLTDAEAFIETFLGENRETLESRGYREVERFPDIVTAGQTGFAIAYRITDPRGLDLYSVLLQVTYPHGRGLIMQWASTESLAAETRDLFLKMVPTISFTE